MRHSKIYFSKQYTGQSMAEIGILLGVIVIGCIGALTLLGGNTATLLGGAAGNGSVSVASAGGAGGAKNATAIAGKGLDLNGDGVADSLSNTDSITPTFNADGSLSGFNVVSTAEDGTQVTSFVDPVMMLGQMNMEMKQLAGDPDVQSAVDPSLLTRFTQASEMLTYATQQRSDNIAAIDQLSTLFAQQGPVPDLNASTPQQYPKEMVEGVLAITQSYMEMSQLYGEVQSQLKTAASSNPEAYADKLQQFNNIANTASSISLGQTMPSILSDLQMSRVNIGDFLAVSGNYGDASKLIMSTYQTTTVAMGTPPSSDPAALTNYYNQFNATFNSQVQGSMAQVAFGDTSALASTGKGSLTTYVPLGANTTIASSTSSPTAARSTSALTTAPTQAVVTSTIQANKIPVPVASSTSSPTAARSTSALTTTPTQAVVTSTIPVNKIPVPVASSTGAKQTSSTAANTSVSAVKSTTSTFPPATASTVKSTTTTSPIGPIRQLPVSKSGPINQLPVSKI